MGTIGRVNGEIIEGDIMDNDDTNKSEFKLYATKHIIVGVLVTVATLWVA